MSVVDTSAEAIAALMNGVTPGPWDWQVSRSTMTVELSGGKQTEAGGDLTVMSFARYGMRSAAPVFWTWDGLTATRVERADKLAIAVPGRKHHADWFARIDHPDASFIAAARELVPALAAERDALRAEAERLQDDKSALVLALAALSGTSKSEIERMRAKAAKLAEALREADVFIKRDMGGLRNTKRDAILADWEAANA